jgi:cell division protein FtsQ
LSSKKQIRKNKYKKPKKKASFGIRLHIIPQLGFCLKTICGVGVLTLMSLSLIFIHDFLTQCDYFRAENIRISGAKRLSDNEILEYAGIQRDKNILAINLTLARKQLLSHPWVADVAISRELPKGISIRIEEHKALAVLIMGRKFLINFKGEIFKENDVSDPKHLPVVRGLDYSDLGPIKEKKSAPLAAVVEWLLMRAKKNNFLSGIEVKEIIIDREIGLTLLLSDDKRSICLGYKDYDQKTNRLRRIVNYLRSKSRLNEIHSINLINPDRVILRPVG